MSKSRPQCPKGSIALEGSIVAMPTTFSNGALQLRDLDDLVRFQSRQLTSGILLGGSVGEGWALSLEELGRLVGRASESAARYSNFRLHVYAGIADIDTRAARDAAVTAAHAGAEALFLSAPPFVRPSVSGLIRHFDYIAAGVPEGLPLVLVNSPQRTGTDLAPAMVRQIIEAVPRIVAHCEGVGHATRARSLAAELPVPLLCGDDRMIGPYVRNGAVGAVSVVGGLVPAEVARLVLEAKNDTNHRSARIADGLERNLAPLIDALRIAPSPVVLKEALRALEGISCSETRAPLAPLGEGDRRALERSLSTARLLIPA